MATRRRPISREEQIIRKREKEYQHQKTWNDQQKYYNFWDKTNTKYEEWTSPRYYDSNTQLVKQMQTEKILSESKEYRRNKLRKLFEEDRQKWTEELMKRKEEDIRSPRSPRENLNDIPTEILKQVHQGIKEREEEKRRKEAELRLYHQWRNNNSFLREYETARRTKDLKVSWLHQQMEKRKRKEREAEEEKRLLLEREERLKSEKEKEEQRKKDVERRNKELKEVIDKQVEQIKIRQSITEKLRQKEEEERLKKDELFDLEQKRKQAEELAKKREIALFNIKQYKIKLMQKLKNIQDNMFEEEQLIKRLQATEIADKLEDEMLKAEVKENIDKFLKLSQEQKKLQKAREKNLQFMFDSEAKAIYERQSEIWEHEDKMRRKLVKEVLTTVADQIEENYKKSREEQEQLIKEREFLIKSTEAYNEELMELQEEERQKRIKHKEELDMEIKKKQEAKKQEMQEDKLKRITEELEKAKIEEDRLKREIMNMHKGQGLCRPPSRNNIVF